ncbi:MAG: beta-lactamase family protein [Ruminococcaceae bacterium]|nr:beta-lactamase family protein [Oscillospiraceae bacterium]
MDFTRLQNYMDRLVNEYNTPSVDCIVYKEHEQLFRYFNGKKDIENNKPIQGDELYIIFSMTKMLTCSCALQLFEQGKFLMSDPVSKFLPEFEKMKISDENGSDDKAASITTGVASGEYEAVKESGYAKNPITIKDLFTMGAGLDYNINADYIKKAISENKTTTREIVRALSETTLGFEPGTRFRYSLCHDVLGALVEVISGKKFGDYMTENLLEPLGMKDTFFGVPKDEEKLSRMTALYAYNAERMPERRPLVCGYNLTDEYQSGGAGLVSNPTDYALFLDALANGGIGKSGKRILSSSTVDLMRTNHMTGKQCEDFDKVRKGYGYGLGVRTHIDKSRSGSLSPIGEFGWDGAAGCFSMVDPSNKLSMTYFQQILGWDLRIQTEMRNVLYSCLD